MAFVVTAASSASIVLLGAALISDGIGALLDSRAPERALRLWGLLAGVSLGVFGIAILAIPEARQLVSLPLVLPASIALGLGGLTQRAPGLWVAGLSGGVVCVGLLLGWPALHAAAWVCVAGGLAGHWWAWLSGADKPVQGGRD